MENKKYDLLERPIDFAVRIISVADALPDSKTGNHIKGQLLRSGTSPASNYGESRSDFIHKIKIALKELRETKVWFQIIYRKDD